MSMFHRGHCEQNEVTGAYALQALPSSEVAAAEAHIVSMVSSCVSPTVAGDSNSLL
jgi:hypothetical protein